MATDGDEDEPDEASEDKLVEAVNASSVGVRNVYMPFLLVGLYILLFVGSTTDEQLLRADSIPLPIINVFLPIVGAYAVVPWLFVLLHFYLLVQIALLARRISLLTLTDARRRMLSHFLITQVLLRRGDDPLIGWLLRLAVWLTLVAGPILLLLFVQVRFVAYHDFWITGLHQGAVLVDLLLLWVLWQRALEYSWGTTAELSSSDAKLGRQIIGLVASFMVIAFSIGDATIPPLKVWQREDLRNLTDRIAKRYIDAHERTLVRSPPPPELIAEYRREGKAGDEAWLEHSEPLDLQGRDLRLANFHGSRLINADLRHASLLGADLTQARLDGANLAEARLMGTVMLHARLQRADLTSADLQGAQLQYASLQGATLNFTHLQGANLEAATLQGASLLLAAIQGAHLIFAQLEGAILEYAKLQGADLTGAQLQGADLFRAGLQGAALEFASLQGASLSEALVGRTDLANSDLYLADFTSISLAPLTGNEWQRLEDEIKKVVPEHLPAPIVPLAISENPRQSALEQLEAARQRGDTLVEKAIPNRELDIQRRLLPPPQQEQIVWHDGKDLTKDWPTPVADYSQQLARFLGSLPCRQEDRLSAQAVFKAVTQRARKVALLQRRTGHFFKIPLAERLLETAKSCGFLQGMDPSVLGELTALNPPTP